MLINRSDVFINQCKQVVADYHNDREVATDDEKISSDDICVVWFCKATQVYKAILCTMAPDGRYYELTLNCDKCKLYLDVYKAYENVEITPRWEK